MQLTEDVDMVVNADDMDDQIFIKHFNARHAGQLAGLSALGEYPLNDEMLELYRKFHDHLHNWLRIDMPHQHRADWDKR